MVLFDFDGTLCDDFEEAVRILNTLSGELGFKQIPPEGLERARSLGSRALLADLEVPLYRLPLLVRRARAELRRKIPQLRPIDGIPEVLRALAARGVPMGIVTSNSKENVSDFLDAHGMKHFEFISSHGNLFGKARALTRLMKARGLDARHTLYVGDETRDVEAAKKAGVTMVAVTWGFASRSALAEYGPLHLIDEPGELLEIAR